MLFSLPCARRPSDDLVEKLIDCMGVSNLNAEMLLANFFNASILGDYARKLGKSDKGGTATLAERIAREWAKPSFAPPAAPSGQKRPAEAPPPEEDAAGKRMSALEEIKAKRAKQAAKQAAEREAPPPPPAATDAPPAAVEAAKDDAPPPPAAAASSSAVAEDDDDSDDDRPLNKWI